MRRFFPNLTRPAKAARRLVRSLSDVKLSSAQGAVAEALGYQNWYELEKHHADSAPTPLDHHWPKEELYNTYVHAVRLVARKLSKPEGEVLNAMSSARLTGDRHWSLEDHSSVRLALWRADGLLRSKRHEPGTVVRVKTGADRGCVAYLRSYGQPSEVLYDSGVGICADFEIVTPREPLPDFMPTRLWLPYGVWKLADKTEVLFSRDYFPLWRINEGGVERLPPWLWIESIVEQRYFVDQDRWDWAGTAARERALSYLHQNDVSGIPMLVEMFPFLFDASVNRFRDGLKTMARATTLSDPDGPWRRAFALGDSAEYTDWI